MPDQKKPPLKSDPKVWSDITRKWAAAGGESLQALNASLHASSKKNPLGLLNPDDPVLKSG